MIVLGVLRDSAPALGGATRGPGTFAVQARARSPENRELGVSRSADAHGTGFGLREHALHAHASQRACGGDGFHALRCDTSARELSKRHAFVRHHAHGLQVRRTGRGIVCFFVCDFVFPEIPRLVSHGAAARVPLFVMLLS